jgi:hypothetical protein
VIGHRVAAAGNDLGVRLPRPRRLFRFVVHPLPSLSAEFGRPPAHQVTIGGWLAISGHSAGSSTP